MYDVQAAVVGVGFIGPVHIEALRRLGVPVAGVLGVDRKESEAAKESLGLPKAYESLEEILEDRAVGTVHLAVPNYLHYEMAKKAVGAGKHVMCEKPLTMHSVQSAELVELARHKRVAAAVCYNSAFVRSTITSRLATCRRNRCSPRSNKAITKSLFARPS